MQAFEKAPPDVQEILSKPIKELGLKLEGSPLERSIQRLYRELERKGIRRFRPLCYLTDEWGCPSGEPVIGIPFYLANPKLARLEKEMNDLEDEREIMMYLRHEAGHAFNYAYRLYETPEWRALFGPFRRPYRESYRPVPFSKRYVRHIDGWYAQKHPDEDFAETFAVWLTPRSNWRKKYRGWGALAKLKYADRIAEELPLEADLNDIFKASRRRKRGVRPAVDLLRENHKAMVDKLTYWTGVQRPLVKGLVQAIESKVGELGLRAEVKYEKEHLTEVTVYATALAMNYLTRGKFVQP